MAYWHSGGYKSDGGLLCLQVGLIQAGMTSEQRRESYAADVTYVTNSELGFDYLRDNIAGVSTGFRCSTLVQESRF